VNLVKKCRRCNNFLSKLILVFISIIATFLLVELIFRLLLFSSFKFIEPLRQPEFYSNDISSDYYRLQHFFTESCSNARDNYLGWVNTRLIFNENYIHRQANLIGQRTPVLLYGDSFAQCLTPSKECFQDILNEDEQFNKKYFFINYGVEGYGLDQIYLLYKKTIPLYSNPIVIISLLDRDLERSMSGSTWGLKPYFTLEGNQLIYHADHLKMNVEEYFHEHPPQITSYLWRLIIHSSVIPENIRSFFTNSEKQKLNLKKLNKKILLEIVNDLKMRNLTYVFLLFEHSKTVVQPIGWRMKFLSRLLEKNSIPFLSARDVIINHEQSSFFEWGKYSLSSKSTHPNFLYNQLISKALFDWLVKTKKD
jgi:hypothetical protein